MQPLPSVTAQEAPRLLDAGAVLIDVREPDEWEAGHAPMARHVPLNTVLAAMDSFPRNAKVLVICRSGNRSQSATAAMRDAGIDAYNVDGGMRAWHQVGGAVLRTDGSSGTVI